VGIRCSPDLGTGIYPDDCREAYHALIRPTRSYPEHELAEDHYFTWATPLDGMYTLPRSEIHATCAIALSIQREYRPSVRTSWSFLAREAKSLVQRCALDADRGHVGGVVNFSNGIRISVINPINALERPQVAAADRPLAPASDLSPPRVAPPPVRVTSPFLRAAVAPISIDQSPQKAQSIATQSATPSDVSPGYNV